jgi:hypothetical protein
MHHQIQFRPIAHSWVAIHPDPKGVIQFIGGAFFGSFPTLFYRYLLGELFAAGYTIVALPFRFSFRHWRIAIDLLKEQEIVRKELLNIARTNDTPSNSVKIYQDRSQYFWVGHSLGCKYITLLEFLSTDDSRLQDIANDPKYPATAYPVQEIAAIMAQVELENASILGQPSLLMAPDISDTSSAIPIRAIADFIDRIGQGVQPSRQQTQDLIKQSNLFNLTGLISFDRDTIAGSIMDQAKDPKIQGNSDVLWLFKYFQGREHPILHQETSGKHLEPIGQRIGSYIVDLNPFDKFIEPLHHRKLEAIAGRFLSELAQRNS